MKVILLAGVIVGAVLQVAQGDTCTQFADVGVDVHANSVFYRKVCRDIPENADYLKLTGAGDYVDYFKPVNADVTFCSMLLSNKLHLWASDPATEFVKLESPRFSHFGGSAFSNDHPVDLGGRKTPYFWGTDAQMFVRGNENVHGAGCCQESRGSADLWNLAFTFDYCNASTTSTATTTTVTGTTTTNTILQALHNRIAELEDGSDVKSVATALENFEAKVAAGLKSQATVDADQTDAAKTQAAQMQIMQAQIAELQQQQKEAWTALGDVRTLVATTLSKPTTPDVDIPRSGCRATGATCAPTVETTADGSGGIVLNALGGKVMFESAECQATDLCKLAQDVAAVLAKFDQD